MFFKELARIASHLDRLNKCEYADKIDLILKLAQTSGPNNLNLPMDSRVVPFQDDEFAEADQERNLNPRYRSKPYFQDTQGNDTEEEHDTSVFGMNSPQNELAGVTGKQLDFYSPSMDMGGGGLKDFEWSQLEKDNPFPNLPGH